MPFNSLLALLDDIATILDDVAVMSRVAVKKTAGLLGDDLALNAEQVSGVKPHRELPVVWAVAKGSALNKAILVPLALVISAVAEWAITPLLMLGGAYLCFEGFEKVAHRWLHSREEDRKHHEELIRAIADPKIDLVAFEKQKVKGAIRTDFILSAEIVVITLGTVADAELGQRVGVLCVIAAAMTVGVYGLVAGIVKLDDIGLLLVEKPAAAARAIGRGVLRGAPFLMKGLSIAGTAAMFLVGGGIVSHGIHVLSVWVERLGEMSGSVPAVGGVLAVLVPVLLQGAIGLIVGALVLLVVTGVKKLLPKKRS